jgi:glutamate-5-semialdehyde dehydrogenase
MDLREEVRRLGRQAREASRALARATAQVKNLALAAMATELRSRKELILEANRADVSRASAKRDAAFVDRLSLSPKLVEQMAEGV